MSDASFQPLTEEAPPAAGALMEALRGVGYSLETAVADLVDNSIAAGAQNVWLHFEWAGAGSWVRLLDDGRGMSEQKLRAAMKAGSRSPLETRSDEDLGRFGLGLKTASLSQCRCLTVATRERGGPTHLRRWDLDHVQRTNAWELLVAAPDAGEVLAPLADLEQGTAVIWQRLDRLVGATSVDDARARDHFQQAVERVEEHLALVFHRFLEEGDLTLYLNGGGLGDQIRPRDPFLSWHPATLTTPEESFSGPGGLVTFQGFVLPHRDKLSPADLKRAGDPDGWTQAQGFYVYRGRRLLQDGGWLGLGDPRRWGREESFKLARLRLDIPNSADREWKIDIKKSVARPPQGVQERLIELARDVRLRARSVLVYRGNYGSRAAPQELIRVWEGRAGPAGTRWQVARSHPEIAAHLEAARKAGLDLEPLLGLIEQSVPVQRIWLDATEQGQVAASTSGPTPEAVALARAFYDRARRVYGDAPAQARERVLRSEPFHQWPELAGLLTEE